MVNEKYTEDDLETYIFNYISVEYPRLTLETIGDIAEIIFGGFEWWKEENLSKIEKYIENEICLCTKDELINIREDLYQQAEDIEARKIVYGEDIDEDDDELIMDYYLELLHDRECCVAFCGARYTTSDIDNMETEDVWIYME